VRPWLASAGAVAAGFLVTAVASTAADAVMHAAGIFASSPRVMSDPLFALASAYRALFTVAGGYAHRPSGARPAHAPCLDPGRDRSRRGTGGPHRLLHHRWAELGPAWYAISIPIEAIPCVWLGARLALAHRSYEHASGMDSPT
jgi:hypothetical protein